MGNEFPTFTSAFKDSPLGEFWDIENKSYKDKIITNDKNDTNILKISNIKYHRVVMDYPQPLDAKGNDPLIEYFYKTLQVPTWGFASCIELKHETGAKPKDIASRKLKTDLKFHSGCVNEILGVRLGKSLRQQEISENDFIIMVEDHLDWIFAEDSEYKNNSNLQKKFSRELLTFAKSNYYYYKKVELAWWEEVLQILSDLAKYLLDIIADILNAFAESIRRLKIQDNVYWDPNNPNFAPVFFPFEKYSDKRLKEIFGDKKGDKNLSKLFDGLIQNKNKDSKKPSLKLFNLFSDLFSESFRNLNPQLEAIIKTPELSVNYLNAFMVGVFNGILEMLAGTAEIVAFICSLYDPEKRKELKDGISKVLQYIEKDGIITFLGEIIKSIFKKYQDLRNIYEVLKLLGEDLAEIIVSVIMAVLTGGATTVATIRLLLTKIDDLLKNNLDEAIKYIRGGFKKDLPVDTKKLLGNDGTTDKGSGGKSGDGDVISDADNYGNNKGDKTDDKGDDASEVDKDSNNKEGKSDGDGDGNSDANNNNSGDGSKTDNDGNNKEGKSDEKGDGDSDADSDTVSDEGKSFDELFEKFGKLVAKGSKLARQQLDNGIKKIDNDLRSSKYLRQQQVVYAKYKKRSKINNKLDEITYGLRHKTLTRNGEVGELAEQIITKIFKGIKPKSPIKTSLTRRYLDNFYNGIIREVKSGDITMSYKKQIDKDIEILSRKLKVKGQRPSRIEWHTFKGISEDVLEYVQRRLKDIDESSDSFQFILH